MAKLYFRYSAMNSGKSTALMQVAFNYEERGQNVLVIKSVKDTKHPGVLSRIGISRKVDIIVNEETDLFAEIVFHNALKKVHCILVDEAQFLSEKNIDDLFAITVIASIPVIAYGIRTDFRTHLFPGSLRLMELAHSIEEMKTICTCGKKAIFNARKIDGSYVKHGEQVSIDGKEATYEPLCGFCYSGALGLPQYKEK